MQKTILIHFRYTFIIIPYLLLFLIVPCSNLRISLNIYIAYTYINKNTGGCACQYFRHKQHILYINVLYLELMECLFFLTIHHLFSQHLTTHWIILLFLTCNACFYLISTWIPYISIAIRKNQFYRIFFQLCCSYINLI